MNTTEPTMCGGAATVFLSNYFDQLLTVRRCASVWYMLSHDLTVGELRVSKMYTIYRRSLVENIVIQWKCGCNTEEMAM